MTHKDISSKAYGYTMLLAQTFYPIGYMYKVMLKATWKDKLITKIFEMTALHVRVYCVIG